MNIQQRQERDDKIALEFLEDAWGYIDTPEKWIKGHYHQGERHCAIGAMECAESAWIGRGAPTPRLAKELAIDALVDAIPAYRGKGEAPIGQSRVIGYNDNCAGYHRIKRAWFKAIEKLQGPTNMDIKEIDVETTHEPLVSPVPGKEVLPEAPAPEIPAVPSVPDPVREPVKV